MRKNFLSILDFTTEELSDILDLANELKELSKKGQYPSLLAGKALAMFFEKPSNRTRVSFDVAIHQLGGYSINLEPSSIQLGGRESIADVARTLSRYVDGAVMRTFSHEMVEEFASHATFPVINGLTDFNHPCQALADIMTIFEKKGKRNDIVLSYVGDGNNVLQSLIGVAVRFGITLRVACPEKYFPEKEVLEFVKKNTKNNILIIDSPEEAVKSADVIYTDVWTSMGHEDEKEDRKKAFLPYQINSRLLSFAKKDAIVMHCLPAHRGEEITDEVIDGQQSVVFDQAENRLHAQKAVLVKLMKKDKE
ncbi:MAG: ornithine carbamoyltransferase [Candidatus Margulisiibacteriota bacterium]|nr:MAG: ornithine carbamoyltransferase [Candidatus Margulisbacteria bacterium GWD2_39_127]OGI04594.1 MAG: ornithine carbamoyltransferase [Candidatus Margulisbacteria bacterium GWF2_38_17]OGI11874.1 MAG: ornithine carbamoyltransferase [Candidatus Margulisbacteria bacterium GWE2_39_32]PZM83115.1 MAG: ornithine carbamoyltransferase [Candidatus Margulisiibacteriota bacterium]HAR62217.1 ornithine carbamoyltransferase [Candidatus Margulisiibacteriota bacterium]